MCFNNSTEERAFWRRAIELLLDDYGLLMVHKDTIVDCTCCVMTLDLCDFIEHKLNAPYRNNGRGKQTQDA